MNAARRRRAVAAGARSSSSPVWGSVVNRVQSASPASSRARGAGMGRARELGRVLGEAEQGGQVDGDPQLHPPRPARLRPAGLAGSGVGRWCRGWRRRGRPRVARPGRAGPGLLAERMCSAWARAVSSAQTSSVSAAVSTARSSAIASSSGSRDTVRPARAVSAGRRRRPGPRRSPRGAGCAFISASVCSGRGRQDLGLHGRGHLVVERLEGRGDGGRLQPEISPRRGRPACRSAAGQRHRPLHPRIRAARGQAQRDPDLVAASSTGHPASSVASTTAARRPAAGRPPTRRPAPRPDQVHPGLPVQQLRVQLGQAPGQHRARLRGPAPHPPTTAPTQPPAPASRPAPPTTTRRRGRRRRPRHRWVQHLVRHASHARGDHRQFPLPDNGFPPSPR
jgi:hypothetical protein